MPSEKKVHWAQLRTGILATVSMTIAGVLIFLLTSQSSLFGGKFRLRTYMEDSAGMVAKRSSMDDAPISASICSRSAGDLGR